MHKKVGEKLTGTAAMIHSGVGLMAQGEVLSCKPLTLTIQRELDIKILVSNINNCWEQKKKRGKTDPFIFFFDHPIGGIVFKCNTSALLDLIKSPFSLAQ